MSPASKTFRVFVSSTFSDLKEERNALQERVFPKLRELCMQHGCRFQAIDLRWGIREEAALDQQTMKICLDEIARCQRVTPRPNFIVLLGERYGWLPLPYEIPAEEFENILRNVSGADERELLTHWYRRDDNAVPPVYCLQPRTGEFVDSAKWQPVEHRLRAILLEAIKQIPIGAYERLKYTTSATEQEIVQGVLSIADASEHVFCFFRSIVVPEKDGSVCPIRDALLDDSFRDFADLDPEGKLDKEAYAQLNDLKERLSRLLPGNVYQYQARWAGNAVAIYLATSWVSSVSEVGVGKRFALGTYAGEVIILLSHNFPTETPIVTPVRIWLYGENANSGRWDDSITTICQWCGKRFPVSDNILDVIKAIDRDANLSPDQSPCLDFPAEAWEEPRLISECPLCHKPLKFNPFIVDNRGKY